MPPTFAVYELIDPRDGKPFYVGSTNRVDLRMRQHRELQSPATAERIAEIIRAGQRPRYRVVATAETRPDVKQAETLHIARRMLEGDTLLNRHGDYERRRAADLVALFKITTDNTDEAISWITPTTTTPLTPDGFLSAALRRAISSMKWAFRFKATPSS